MVLQVIGSICAAAMIICTVVETAGLYNVCRVKVKTEELDRRLYKLEVEKGTHDERNA